MTHQEILAIEFESMDLGAKLSKLSSRIAQSGMARRGGVFPVNGPSDLAGGDMSYISHR